MTLIEMLNDKSWSLLEATHLDTFFEEKNIPPLVFPAGILVILLLIAFLLMSGGAPSETIEDVCGDSVCSSNETTLSCSTDCPPPELTGKRVTIQLDADPFCQLTVKLYDSGAKLLSTQRGTKNSFIFDGVDSDEAYVQVEGPYEKSQKSPTTTLSDDETINLIFDESICEEPKSATGVLRLSVQDSSTGSSLNGVSISIAETSGGQILGYLVSGQIINGAQDFALPYDTTYTIYATRDGYVSGSETANVKEGRATSQVISLVPEEPGAPDTGELEVCVKNDTEFLTSGFVSVESLAGDYFQSDDLANAGSTPSPTLPGCYVFTGIPGGSSVIASMANPPSDCIPAATETIHIFSGSRKISNLELTCGASLSGYLKIKVIGEEGLILTENATITIWAGEGEIVPGNGLASSLSMGSDGYSEEVDVPTDGTVYVWVRGLPFGYGDYKSEFIIIEQDEHKELVIDLDYSEESGSTPSEGFIFDGVSYPSYVLANTSFEVTINEILYADTTLNGNNARLKVYAGDEICDVVYDSTWTAYCISSEDTGIYGLTMIARYEGLTETLDGDFEVREYGSGAGVVKIIPLSSTHDEPPLTLNYKITVNDEDVTDIPEQELTLEYVDSPDAYPGEVSELVLSDGIWSIVADVPYYGDYKVGMQIYIYHEGVYYNTSYSLYFTATDHSDSLVANIYIPYTTISTSESFITEVNLNFNNEVAYGLDVFEVYMDGVFYTLEWSEDEQLYEIQMASPSVETCTESVTFGINGKEIDESETLHIIDTSKTKSGTCPMERDDSCNNIEEVRKCFYDHNSKTAFYTSAQLTACISAGCSSSMLPSCPSTNKGDIDLDCQLTSTDLTLFQEYLEGTSSISDRNLLTDCLDMDNDGDVDNDDVTCMTYMISTKWYGDTVAGTTGDSCLSGYMDGGFCFDIGTDSALPGDVYSDSILDIEDEYIISDIINTISDGVTPDQDILDITDFNQDGTVDSTDLNCLRKFYSVDFSDGTVTPGSGSIPTECFNIFNLGCLGDRADLNADGSLSTIDLIILRFIVADRLSSAGLFTCADVDTSGVLDDYDIECFESYFEGTDLWASCLDCEADLPIEAYSTVEICNDGYDNDCDGLTDDGDPRCECISSTPCDMYWDIDGGTPLGIDDDNYKRCVKIDSDYEWTLLEDLAEECDQSGDWSETYYCNEILYTCVYNFSDDFAYSDGSEGVNATDFVWLQGTGNIGPRHKISHCGSTYPACADNWEEVRQHLGSRGDCGTLWDRAFGAAKRYTWCRFQYDFCDGYYCEPVGSTLYSCNSTAYGDSQECYNETSCCGIYEESTDYTWTECSAESGLCS